MSPVAASRFVFDHPLTVRVCERDLNFNIMLHLLSEHQLGGIRCIDCAYMLQKDHLIFALHNTKEYINFYANGRQRSDRRWLVNFFYSFFRNVLILPSSTLRCVTILATLGIKILMINSYRYVHFWLTANAFSFIDAHMSRECQKNFHTDYHSLLLTLK